MATPKLTTEMMTHVADLACLMLSNSEMNTFQVELTTILDHVDNLNEIDTNRSFDTLPSDTENSFRSDKPTPSLTQEEALSNSNGHAKGGYFTSHVVLDHS